MLAADGRHRVPRPLRRPVSRVIGGEQIPDPPTDREAEPRAAPHDVPPQMEPMSITRAGLPARKWALAVSRERGEDPDLVGFRSRIRVGVGALARQRTGRT